MMESKAKSSDKVSGAIERFSGFGEGAAGGGIFIFEAYDKDGNLKWRDEAKNLTTNVGRQDMNAKYFLGSGYTAGWFIGLVNNTPAPSYAVTDTMASHAGWDETQAYDTSNRATATFGTATDDNPSVISNSVASGGTVASFVIDDIVTIDGAFLTDTQAKSPGNTGILFSVAAFEVPGDRSVVAGDTLNVTYQFSLTDA
jgi:hypothetical protein